MTKRHGLTRGDRFDALERQVKDMEMAVRVSQMLLQQISNSIQPLSRDVGELANRQREVQYKVLAVQNLLSLEADKINEKAGDLQLKDFEEASAKEDLEKGYLEASLVAEDSVVILTSTAAAAPEKSILRSKLLISEIGFPQLKADLVGKKVGDKVSADIGGVKHEITLLAIRATPAKLEVTTEAQA